MFSYFAVTETFCSTKPLTDMTKRITDFAKELLRLMQRIAENGKDYCPISWDVCGRNLHIHTFLCFLQEISNKKINQFFLTIYLVLGCFHFGDDQVFIVIHCNSVKRNYFTHRKNGIQRCQMEATKWLSSRVKF